MSSHNFIILIAALSWRCHDFRSMCVDVVNAQVPRPRRLAGSAVCHPRSSHNDMILTHHRFDKISNRHGTPESGIMKSKTRISCVHHGDINAQVPRLRLARSTCMQASPRRWCAGMHSRVGLARPLCRFSTGWRSWRLASCDPASLGHAPQPSGFCNSGSNKAFIIILVSLSAHGEPFMCGAVRQLYNGWSVPDRPSPQAGAFNVVMNPLRAQNGDHGRNHDFGKPTFYYLRMSEMPWIHIITPKASFWLPLSWNH